MNFVTFYMRVFYIFVFIFLYVQSLLAEGDFLISEEPSIKLDKVNFMTNSGKTVNIAARVSDKNSRILWSSDNEKVASVDQRGNVRAHSRGEAMITASVGGAIAKCRVSVDYEGQNPYLPPSWGLYICDPEPFVMDGKLYVFGSKDRPMSTEPNGSRGFCSSEYNIIYTEDMINWTDAGVSLSIEDIPQKYRGGKRLWGPSALFKAREKGNDRDKYYFIASTSSYTSGMILFESESPTGPFVNPRPMTMDGKVIGNLDPGVLADDDGKVYFAYQYDGYRFAICQLDPSDFSKLLSGTKVDVTDVFKSGNPREWPDEGQSLKKRNGIYYYLNMLNWQDSNMQDANHKRIPVKMAYLMAKSPLGPWTYGGKIIDTYHYLDSGNIQGSFAEFKGKSYVFYHMPTPDSSLSRYGFLDPIDFNADGTIRQIEPTSSGAKGAFRKGEKIQASSGVHFSGGRGDKRIVQRYKGDIRKWWLPNFAFTDYPETWYSKKGQFIGYRYMDFTADIKSLEISVKTSGSGGVLKIYKGSEKGSENDTPGEGLNQPSKDGPSGEAIALIELPDTKGKYETLSVPLVIGKTGIYSFYIVLDSVAKGGRVYVDSICFK